MFKHGFKLLDTPLRPFLQKHAARWREDGPWRLPSLAYTTEHKLAFLEREHYRFGRYTWAGLKHDCDKLVMYTLPWLSEKETNKIHRHKQPHHFNYHPWWRKTVENLMETYIDWDCAAITKPDKPLNAFATLIHFYSNQMETMLPVCLAINPQEVSVTLSDLDAARKTNKSYVFATPEQSAQTFKKARFTVEQIAHNMPGEKYFNQLTLADYPEHIHAMAPNTLFLKTVLTLAKMRNETVDVDKMRQTIQAIRTEFQNADGFTLLPVSKPGEPVAIDHHHSHKMTHPFIRPRERQ